MFGGRLLNFIQCFVCISSYCLLVQGNEETGKKLPNFSPDTKGAQGPPKYHKEARHSGNHHASSGKHLDKKDISNKPENSTTMVAPSSSFNYALWILTLSSFSVSTACHSIVLITYGLFRQLRNVPGLNLMNLCLSLALSQLTSLIAIAYFQFHGTIACEVLGILVHYLREASFLAISVISYHTWYIFSQPFVGRIANRARSKFIKYSIVVWLIPAVLVAISVTLDKTETFPVNYGKNCWIGSKNGRVYFYVIPTTVLILINIYKFIQTANSLSRHYRQTQTIQRKKGKQNILVCAKLAALVSCPCALAFLAVLWPGVEALHYLYAVFLCLQGVYIAQLFLLNKRTLKLYKDWWRKRKNVGAQRPKNVARPTRNVVQLPLTNTAFRLL